MVRHTDSIIRVGVAKDELDALEESTKPICNIDSHVVYADSDPETPEAVVFRAHRILRCEPRWSITVGEICHNLRAALDGIAWDYSTIPIKLGHRDRRTQFPICLDPVRFADDGVNKQMSRIPTVHQRSFEMHQPYRGANLGSDDPLWLLKEMNDTDKHRFLHMTALVARDVVLTFPGVEPESVEILRGTNFETGAKLFGYTRKQTGPMVLDYEIPLEVCFTDRLDPIKGRPVIATMRAIYKRVDEVVQWFVQQSPPFSNAGLVP